MNTILMIAGAVILWGTVFCIFIGSAFLIVLCAAIGWRIITFLFAVVVTIIAIPLGLAFLVIEGLYNVYRNFRNRS